MPLLAPHRRGHGPVALAELSERSHGNPVAASIELAEVRTRGWIAESSVESRARQLHADNSFASWEKLPDTEKRLWRHLARVEFLGDAAQSARGPGRR